MEDNKKKIHTEESFNEEDSIELNVSLPGLSIDYADNTDKKEKAMMIPEAKDEKSGNRKILEEYL